MSTARLDLVAPSLLDALAAAAAGGDPSALELACILAAADYRACEVDDRATSLEAHVLDLLGVKGETAPALAGVYAALDFDLPLAPTDLVCVEPVHLRADATRVVLFDAATVGIDAAEADALMAHLNAGLEPSRALFTRGAAPARWYLRVDSATHTGSCSPRSLRGRHVEDSLHALRGLGALNRLLTEAQMLLHDAPLNVARAARGRAPLNGVWLWGGGEAPHRPGADAPLLVGDDDLLRALARRFRLEHVTGHTSLAARLARGGDVLMLLDGPPGHMPDLAALLHEVFKPARTALRRGRVARVVVHARQARLELSPRAAWRLWRRAGGLLTQLANDRERD